MLGSMKVKDYMAKHLVTFREDTDVFEAITVLLKHKISGAPVVDKQGTLLGVLSEKDCLKTTLSSAYHEGYQGQVGDYMSQRIDTVDANMDIVTLAERFIHSSYRRFPVVENGQLIGQISRRDILRALQDARVHLHDK